MVINNNVTFRRKHRPVWHGMLCLVLITAAVAAVGLLPAQIDDAEPTEGAGDHILTDGDKNIIDSDGKLESIIGIINGLESVSIFTITMNGNDSITSGYTVNAGKNITLTSSSDEMSTLTITSPERHFIVASGATLTLENIILDGGKDKGNIGGGIEVEKGGTLVMNDGAVIQKCSVPGTYTFGGGVYNSGTFTMKDGKIINNTADEGGGVFNSDGAFTMEGGEISGNNAVVGGGVFNIDGAFTMEGGEISDNETEWLGGGVFTMDGAFTMEGGEISGNNALVGGGVHNSDGAFTMEGGEISGNNAFASGGGVYNGNDSTFTMGGGEISGNKAEVEGGGVSNNGMFTMTNSTISGNEAGRGGSGVYSLGTFTMTNSTISGNTSNYGSGGGVYSLGTFTMSGGEISGNTAKLGGGVYNRSGTSDITGGKISGNTAELGGGVYNRGTFTITDGEISGNTATSTDPEKGSGGGIFTESLEKLFIKPAAGKEVVFSGNTAPTLRMFEIYNEDVLTYNQNITGKVVLDERVNVGQNVPAYNNHDICYPGDTWVVSIYIEPNGGGTVTVTENGNEHQIPDKVGWVYLPAVAGSISLSAAPADDNEFIRFIKTGTDEVITPDDVPITGNISITAEFRLAYFITPEADDGSEISPNEVVKVMQGENVTFEFSAKSGYHITAVYVDGKEISSSDLASGEYTFSNVLNNHTIRVESKTDNGNGGETGTGPGDGNGTGPGNGNGTGPGNGNGTGPGNGNGTGPGSDGGKGDIEDGNGNGSENVGSGPSLSESLSGEWSILGMICATLAILTGMIAVVAGKDRFRTDGEKRSKTGMTLRVVALMIGIVSVAAFFLTEDRSLSAAAFGEWTLLMFVLFLAALILAMVSFRFDKTDG